MGTFVSKIFAFCLFTLLFHVKVRVNQEEKKFPYLLLSSTEHNVRPWFFKMPIHNAHLRQYYLQYYCRDFFHDVRCATVLNMNTHTSINPFHTCAETSQGACVLIYISE